MDGGIVERLPPPPQPPPPPPPPPGPPMTAAPPGDVAAAVQLYDLAVPRSARSSVWRDELFLRSQLADYSMYAFCVPCKRAGREDRKCFVRMSSKAGTSNLRQHLRCHHKALTVQLAAEDEAASAGAGPDGDGTAALSGLYAVVAGPVHGGGSNHGGGGGGGYRGPFPHRPGGGGSSGHGAATAAQQQLQKQQQVQLHQQHQLQRYHEVGGSQTAAGAIAAVAATAAAIPGSGPAPGYPSGSLGSYPGAGAGAAAPLAGAQHGGGTGVMDTLDNDSSGGGGGRGGGPVADGGGSAADGGSTAGGSRRGRKRLANQAVPAGDAMMATKTAELADAVADWLAATVRPPSTVEDPRFAALFDVAAAGKVKVPTADQLLGILAEKRQLAADRVRRAVAGQQVAVVPALWRVGGACFLAVSAQWLDDRFVLRRATLSCRPLPPDGFGGGQGGGAGFGAGGSDGGGGGGAGGDAATAARIAQDVQLALDAAGVDPRDVMAFFVRPEYTAAAAGGGVEDAWGALSETAQQAAAAVAVGGAATAVAAAGGGVPCLGFADEALQRAARGFPRAPPVDDGRPPLPPAARSWAAVNTEHQPLPPPGMAGGDAAAAASAAAGGGGAYPGIVSATAGAAVGGEGAAAAAVAQKYPGGADEGQMMQAGASLFTLVRPLQEAVAQLVPQPYAPPPAATGGGGTTAEAPMAGAVAPVLQTLVAAMDRPVAGARAEATRQAVLGDLEQQLKRAYGDAVVFGETSTLAAGAAAAEMGTAGGAATTGTARTAGAAAAGGAAGGGMAAAGMAGAEAERDGPRVVSMSPLLELASLLDPRHKKLWWWPKFMRERVRAALRTAAAQLVRQPAAQQSAADSSGTGENDGGNGADGVAVSGEANTGGARGYGAAALCRSMWGDASEDDEDDDGSRNTIAGNLGGGDGSSGGSGPGGGRALRALLYRADKEVSGYLREPRLPEGGDPLTWWRERSHSGPGGLPTLSRLARRYLALPATAAEVETLLSTDGFATSGAAGAIGGGYGGGFGPGYGSFSGGNGSAAAGPPGWPNEEVVCDMLALRGSLGVAEWWSAATESFADVRTPLRTRAAVIVGGAAAAAVKKAAAAAAGAAHGLLPEPGGSSSSGDGGGAAKRKREKGEDNAGPAAGGPAGAAATAAAVEAAAACVVHPKNR